MNVQYKRIMTLLCPLFLSACITMPDGIFDKDNRPEPMPLSDSLIKNTDLRSTSVNTAILNGDAFSYTGALLHQPFLYLAGKNGVVARLNASDQTIVWQQQFNTRFTGSIALSPDQRYLALGANSNELYLVNAQNGDVIWKKSLDGTLFTSVAFASDHFIVKTSTGNVFAYSMLNGKLLWSFEQTEPTETIKNNNHMIIYGNNVIIAFNNDKVVSLKASNGELNWVTSLNKINTRQSSAAISLTAFASQIIVNSERSGLTSIHSQDGRIQWQRTDFQSHSPVAADSKRVYLTDHNGFVYALNRLNGKLEWENKQIKGHFLGVPTLAGSHLAITNKNGYVHCLNYADGKLTAHLKLANYLHAESLQYNDNLIFPTSHGQVIFTKNNFCETW